MLPRTTFGALLPLVGFFGPVHSWQQEVHNQIGFMADEMISTATREMVASILEPEYQGSLGRAAGWADTVRRSPHPYSYTWHFISARDNPPDDCGLYYHRDCQKGGCVVQQISNQTKILEKCLRAQQNGGIDEKGDYNSRSPDKIVCSEALKWVTHFAGDVAQPLHTSNRATGGNSIKVKFNGTDSDLHKVRMTECVQRLRGQVHVRPARHARRIAQIYGTYIELTAITQVWDRDILYAMAPLPNGPPATSLHPFFAGLVSRIRDDAFRSPRSSWAMCDFDARRDTFCPEQWARDSNAIVCDYAYGRYVEGSDLFLGSDQYAQGAMHIVEQQIAKAAFRLTGWLDALVERVSAEADGPDGSSRTDESRDKPRIQSTSNEL